MNWQRRLGNGLMGLGVVLLAVIFVVLAQAGISNLLGIEPKYLVSSLNVGLALPALTPTPTSAAPMPPKITPSEPVIRLEVPRFDVDRPVVPLGYKLDADGILTWDTDSLFATQNRPDLVGQLAGSPNPGDGGNVVLAGHNYNQGRFNWRGAFIDVGKLQAGDLITATTASGDQWIYTVKLVTHVPWRDKSESEWLKHAAYLGKTEHEQLTLVTCGGANVWPFPERVYVVALPVSR